LIRRIDVGGLEIKYGPSLEEMLKAIAEGRVCRVDPFVTSEQFSKSEREVMLGEEAIGVVLVRGEDLDLSDTLSRIKELKLRHLTAFELLAVSGKLPWLQLGVSRVIALGSESLFPEGVRHLCLQNHCSCHAVTTCGKPDIDTNNDWIAVAETSIS